MVPVEHCRTLPPGYSPSSSVLGESDGTSLGDSEGEGDGTSLGGGVEGEGDGTSLGGGVEGESDGCWLGIGVAGVGGVGVGGGPDFPPFPDCSTSSVCSDKHHFCVRLRF